MQRRRALTFGTGLVIAAGLAFPVYGGNRAAVLRVPLKAVNGSGQSGVAILTPTKSGSGFTVVVKITRGKPEPGEHAHIHHVTCAQYARIAPHPRRPTAKQINDQLATISDGLNDLSGGKSVSSVISPLAKVTTGHYSVNVHQAGDPYTAVACGNIPKR